MSQSHLHLKLFRQAAVDAHTRRWLGDLQVASAPGTGAAVLAALVVILLLAIAMSQVEVPERVSAAGALMPARKLLNVQAPRAGVITELAVTEGELVQQGELLMVIGGAASGAAESSPNRKSIESLQRELDLLIAAGNQELQEHLDNVKAMQIRQQLGRKKLIALADELRTRDAQLHLEQRRLERVEELTAKGVLPAQSVDEQTYAVLQSSAAKTATLQRQLDLQEGLAMLARELESRATSHARILLRGQREREAVQRQVLALEGQSETKLVAPGGGKVAGLLVQHGDSVAAGQRLLTVFDPDSELQAYLYISADEAGRIQPGQRIELQLHAFPYQLYGTLSADVLAVSAVPVPSASVGISLPTPGAVFEIRAALHELGSSEDDWIGRLGPGASFRADLIANRWPLHLWLLGSGRQAV